MFPHKSVLGISLALLLIFALLVHPIWSFWWIEEYLPRRILGLIILATVLVIVGLNVPIEEREGQTNIVYLP